MALHRASAPDGRPLLDVSIDLATIASERASHRRAVGAVAVALVALTVLLLAGPLLDARIAARAPRREMQLTFTIVAVVVIGTALLAIAFAVSPWSAVPANRKAFKLLIGGLSSAAVAATLVSAAVRLRVALRVRRPAPERSPAVFIGMQLACGLFVAALLVLFERVLGRSVDPAAVDLRHFSLHPWTSARLATLTGILLSHAAVPVLRYHGQRPEKSKASPSRDRVRTDQLLPFSRSQPLHMLTSPARLHKMPIAREAPRIRHPKKSPERRTHNSVRLVEFRLLQRPNLNP